MANADGYFSLDFDRLRVRLESFGAGERQNGRRQPREAGARDALHRHHAHEVGGAEAAAEARGAGRRQHVVRSGRVVAGGLRGVRADEHGARGDRPLRAATRGRRPDAPARCGWRSPSPRRRIAVTMIAPLRGQRRAGRSPGRRLCRRPPRRRDRPARRLQVMKIARASGSCSACAIRSAAIQAGRPGAGDDHDLGRPGIEIDRAVAGDERLRGRDIAVARARRSCPRAASSPCHRPAPRSRARRRRGTAASRRLRAPPPSPPVPAAGRRR